MSIPFGLLLSWRRLTGPDRVLSILTILAIAASVTLATGLEMASRSAQVQIARTADAMIGSAKIEVIAGTVGIPESLLETVRAVPGVLAASPMLTATLRLPGRDFALEIVGVDFLAQEQVRPATIRARGVQVRDPLRLLALPNAVIVTRKLLDRLGLPSDSAESAAPTIAARFAGRELVLSVRGVLEPGGLAEAYGGQVAAMDVYALQELVGRRGWFDRVDVVPEPGQTVDGLIAQIAERVRGIAQARRSAFQTRDTEDMLAAIRIVVLLFTGMVTIVASLITYGAMTLFADVQRRQLFVLRAAGLEAERARRGLLLDVSVLGLLGTIAGWVGGLVVSEPLLRTLSIFLTENVSAEEVQTLSIGTTTIVVALASGWLAAGAGGLAAARRVGRRFLLDTLDRATTEPVPGGGLRATRLVWLLAAAAVALPLAMPPVVRVVVVFAAGLCAILALSHAYPGLARLLVAPLRAVVPSTAHLVGRSFAAAPWSFAMVLTAIATSTGSLTGLFLVTESAAETLVEWAASLSSGSTSIRAGSALSVARRELLSPRVLDLIRTTPGVLAVNETYRADSLLFRGEEVSLSASSMDAVARYGRLAAVDRPYRALAAELAQGAIAVSTGFARRFGVATGDSISLDTAKGATDFGIAGQIRDFGLPAGTVLMDVQTFDKHWHRSGAWSASIWTSEPRAEILAAIEARTSGLQDLFFVDASTLVARQRRFADQFLGPLNVAGAFVAVLAAVGVAFLLFATVARRRRELAILRAAGAEPRQVVGLILIDGLAVTILGALLGLSLGYASAPAMTDVLRATSGWDIAQSWFAPAVPIIFFGGFGVALVASVLPARVAFRTLPSEVFAPE